MPTSLNRFMSRGVEKIWPIVKDDAWRYNALTQFRGDDRGDETRRLPMSKRVFNFSAGPAVLPEPVLAEAQRDLMALPGVGASVMEISHRSKAFENIIQQAETNLRQLLAIPDDYAVLFLQGGARLLFSMIPMNLAPEGGQTLDYVITGSWSKYAAQEAAKFGILRSFGDGNPTNYARLPPPADLKFDPAAAFVYFVSNGTIRGAQVQGGQ